MNLDELVAWAKKILAYLDERARDVPQKDEEALCEKKDDFSEVFDQFGWVKPYEYMIREMDELLLIGRIVRQKIRTEGLRKETSEELERELQGLVAGERADQFAGTLLEFVTNQSKNIEQVALDCTEIIESSFGKLKQLMDEDTKEGFTPFILALVACLGKLDLDVVQTALRTCSKRQVKQWASENIGETVRSQRRRLFGFLKRRRQEPMLFARNDGGSDHDGIFSEQVVNL